MHALRQLVNAPRPPSSAPVGYIPESSMCANCGKTGHYYKDCDYPICSFGIICFRLAACVASSILVPQFLMVQRKDSLMYVEFVRGKYKADDRNYVISIIQGMTADEQATLRTMSFIQLWQSVWGKSAPKKCLAMEFNTATRLYHELTDGSLGYTLSDLLDNIITCIPEREWGFPKGRRNIRESDEMCALREFNEETGVHCMAIQRFYMSFEEVFKGSNGVSYKHKYFLARLMDPLAGNTGSTVNETQAKEISCTKWMTFQEAMSKFLASESRQGVMRAANLETMKVMTCGGVYLS